MTETQTVRDSRRPGAELAVRIRDLTRTFGSGDVAVDALSHVDIDIPAGEFVVILGASGSGKTTLLNIVGGIDRPTSGSVAIAGTDITGLDRRESTKFRRDNVGFVFQFFNLVPTLTARENVELIAGISGDAAGQRTSEVLGSVGLEDRADHFPSALSGGQQQRVAIARALVKGPPLVLCDEPTGSLDLETGRMVLSLLRRLNREGARTVLLVTHNSVIARMADRVVRLRDGRIVEDSKVSDPVPVEELEW